MIKIQKLFNEIFHQQNVDRVPLLKTLIIAMFLVVTSFFTGQHVYAGDSSIINVKDFGAIGDGMADDTAAIKKALIQAVGKRLFFPAGKYRVTSTLKQEKGNLDMCGIGNSSVIMGDADPLFMSDEDVKSYLHIHDLMFQPTSYNRGIFFTKKQTADFSETMGNITNVEFYSEYNGGTDGPVFLDIFGAEYLTVERCRFRRNCRSIPEEDMSTGTAIRVSSDQEYHTVQISINNCTMHYLKYGIHHPLTDEKNNGVYIVDGKPTNPISQGIRINNVFMHGIWYGIHMTRMEQASIIGGLIDNCVRPIILDSSQNNYISVPWIVALGENAIEIKTTYAIANATIFDVTMGSLAPPYLDPNNITNEENKNYPEWKGPYYNNEKFWQAIYFNGSESFSIDGAIVSNCTIWCGINAGITAGYTANSFLGQGCIFRAGDGEGSRFAIQEISNFTEKPNLIGMFQELGSQGVYKEK